MIETMLAFLYVVFGELFMWIAAFLLAALLGFYIVNLFVEHLNPEGLGPDD